MVESATDWVAWMAAEGPANVKSRPGHAAVIRGHYAAWMIPQSESAVGRSLRHISHYISAIWVFYLHASPGGITFSALSDLLGASGMASARRARPMLIYLQFIGYIEPAPAGDGRVKRWRPTAKMEAAFSRRMADDLAGMVGLDADIDALARRFDEHAVFARFMLAMGEIAKASFAAYVPDADSLDLFSQRTAGLALMAELLLGGDPQGDFPPVGPVRYSLAGLARRNKVSRMHVRRLLADAEKAGFLRQTVEGEAVISATLARAAEHLFAYTVLNYSYCARAALEGA